MAVTKVTVIMEMDNGKELRVETKGPVLDTDFGFEPTKETPGQYPEWGFICPPEVLEAMLIFKIKLGLTKDGGMYLVTVKSPLKQKKKKS